MKTCPVCNATCFDDMDACYECLHRFSEEERVIAVSDEESAPLVSAEYIEASPSSDEEASEMAGCLVLRIEIPHSKGSFTVRCDNLRIEGDLA